MEEHLPFTVEHHLRGPYAGRAAGHTHEDMVGLMPIDDLVEQPLGQAQLSHLMPWWMVTPNSKPERSMAIGSGDGDAGG
jgi:hypothetical protein